MHNSNLFLVFALCIVTFQQTHALRRIKRGSTATQNKTKLSNDILLDMHNISNDVKLSEHAAKNAKESQAIKEPAEGTWAKKAVAAVEHAIDKAFASLSHKSDEEKMQRHAEPILPLPLHYTANNVPLKSTDSGKELHKPSLSYMLENRMNADRLFGNMAQDVEFGAGDGPAEVLIIDNDMQPMMGMQHGLNSFAFHQPNIANSLKRLAELNKQSKINNLNALKDSPEHSNHNNQNLVGTQKDDNRISEGNAHKEDAMLEYNKRNDNHNNSPSTVGSHNRNNDHITASSEENNGKTAHNGNNNNDALIDEKSQQNSCMRQQQQLQHNQQSEVKQSFPALLSLGHQAMASIGDSGTTLQEHSQAHQQQQRMKHDKTENDEENGQSSLLHGQTKAQAETRQQYSQFVKHTNGKMLPMESFLKFANMMMYKVRPDGTPIHAQGAQLAVNGNPTTSVISITPSKDGAEDGETIDYIYKSLEDPQFHFLRNPAFSPISVSSLSAGPRSTQLMSRPFLLPPYSLSVPAPPFNLLENALDLVLGGVEDEGNDEMEIVCPIHHPKKKSSESAAEDKDKDGIIQVCSCRFFKKNKNA